MPDLNDSLNFLEEYQHNIYPFLNNIPVYVVSAYNSPQVKASVSAFPFVKKYIDKPISTDFITKYLLKELKAMNMTTYN